MNQNRIIAIIILVFNAWWAYLTSKLPKGTFEGEPGPRFFPYLILGLMTALAIVLFFQREKKAEGDFPEILVEEDGEKIEVPKKKHFPMKSVFLYFGVFLGGIILVYFIGFILGMIISITAMLVLIGW
ncbi:MAG: tripartite tricarboxylate transporter TctB family protein, partial [Sphaerochaetaceae bacterium]